MSKIGILLMDYGTPDKLEDVEAYYTHIRRGKPPTKKQLEDLIGRYQKIGGCSPLNQITLRQAEKLEEALRRDGWETKVFVGHKHWHPFIAEAVREMANEKIEKAVGIVLAPHYSKLSVGQYIEYALKARDQFASNLSISFVKRWGSHPKFIEAVSQILKEALNGAYLNHTTVIFSAHSLPERIRSWNDPYESELHQSAKLVADKLRLPNWTFAYQSASNSGEPWLGPDLLSILEQIASQPEKFVNPPEHIQGVVICPIGFISDHLEILYDLDLEAANRCVELGLCYQRTRSLNDDPALIQILKFINLDQLAVAE